MATWININPPLKSVLVCCGGPLALLHLIVEYPTTRALHKSIWQKYHRRHHVEGLVGVWRNRK